MKQNILSKGNDGFEPKGPEEHSLSACYMEHMKSLISRLSIGLYVFFPSLHF